jgi:hypothetical protein
VQVKRGIFVITEKPTVVFAKQNWIRGNFKISEGWFCKHIFSYFILCKKYIYLSKSFIWNICAELYKNLGKVVKTRVLM